MSQHALSRPPALLSPEEYLVRELAASVKHEFVDGAVYAMGEKSARHSLVRGSLAAALHSHLQDCRHVFMADLKIFIKIGDTTRFYYPDIFVSRADDDRADRDFREQPILVVEVLSPSTERVDRTEKFDAYRRIPSLQEYVLADQDMPKVEVFRRRAAWAREEFYPDDRFPLESAELELAVAQVYRRVSF